MIDWVKISDRLPDVNREVIIVNVGRIREAEFVGVKNHEDKYIFTNISNNIEYTEVTHWIYKENLLPKPELRPCPFCGNKDIKLKKCELTNKVSIILCKPCNVGFVKDNHEECVEMWNTRVE